MELGYRDPSHINVTREARVMRKSSGALDEVLLFGSECERR